MNRPAIIAQAEVQVGRADLAEPRSSETTTPPALTAGSARRLLCLAGAGRRHQGTKGILAGPRFPQVGPRRVAGRGADRFQTTRGIAAWGLVGDPAGGLGTVFRPVATERMLCRDPRHHELRSGLRNEPRRASLLAARVGGFTRKQVLYGARRDR